MRLVNRERLGEQDDLSRCAVVLHGRKTDVDDASTSIAERFESHRDSAAHIGVDRIVVFEEVARYPDREAVQAITIPSAYWGTAIADAVASPADPPAMAVSINAQSSAVHAIGPTWSSVWASGMTPPRPTRP